MAADEGFEPSKWRIQSPLPYRLANPQDTYILYNINTNLRIQIKFTLEG